MFGYISRFERVEHALRHSNSQLEPWHQTAQQTPYTRFYLGRSGLRTPILMTNQSKYNPLVIKGLQTRTSRGYEASRIRGIIV
jgi:hypothetical protein